MSFKKNLSLLPLILIGPCLSSFTFIPIVQEAVSYGMEIIGPFYKDDGARTISLSYTYNSSDFILEAREKVYVYKGEQIDGNKSTIYSSPLHTLVEDNSYSYSFSFYPTKYFDDIRGAYFTFEIIDSKNSEVIHTKTVHLFLAYEDEVNEGLLDGATYKLGSTYTTLGFGRLISLEEIFDFSEFSFTIDNSPIGVIDTSNFKFTYRCIFPLNYEHCFVTLTTNTHMFPEIGGGGTGLIEFPCNLIQNSTEVTLDFSCNYVNPKTLYMSNYPKDGYVPSKNIYIPYEYFSELESIHMNVTLLSVGVHRTTFRFESVYYPTNNLIGECHNSDYCIVGNAS